MVFAVISFYLLEILYARTLSKPLKYKVVYPPPDAAQEDYSGPNDNLIYLHFSPPPISILDPNRRRFLRPTALSSWALLSHNTAMKKQSHYFGHRFPPEIISYTVWLYHQFVLSLPDIEDLLAERGIVTYDTVRQWCLKFGLDYAKKLRKRQSRLRDA